ncbi:MAG: SDR family oxidoreductase [Pseudomonadota bacterium]
MNQLKDKVVVVTGASSGIGQAISQACAKAGANVVVNYRQSASSAEKVVEDIKHTNGKAMAIQADMRDEKQIHSLINQTKEAFGKIDAWVNNAGADILTGEGAQANFQQKLHQLIEVDLKGTMKACWLMEKEFRKQGQGVFVNMSWDLSMHGFHGDNPQIFAATKAGILGFTRSFAKSIGPTIRANVVSPGWIATVFAEEHMDKKYFNERISEIPLGRFGRPEDVAAAVLFLVSDESSYMTGEAIKINGGLV